MDENDLPGYPTIVRVMDKPIGFYFQRVNGSWDVFIFTEDGRAKNSQNFTSAYTAHSYLTDVGEIAHMNSRA